ncbi:hypothetical protein N7530_009142 [Penicillium desertorum]|uniref:AB hydrolase-1 domain-containing protein n=1 Tax=Penicillium desertorum TaxID=1303715 RepID=A0A9X0BLJ9_9EURO|nr:hypothetical protein N7530_009142 [Penicillium desertorum]
MNVQPGFEEHAGARDASQSLGLVFVHGFNSSPSVWDQFVSLLNKDPEFRIPPRCCLRFQYATAMFKPWSPLTRLPTLGTVAGSLRVFLETEAANFDHLLLICHSQGGLVVQRFLAQMVQSGRGIELDRIRRVILFACPNSGSQLGLTLRRRILRGHPQEYQLRPLSVEVHEVQRTIIRQIVYATRVAPHECRITFAVYAGDSDNIVDPVSAQAVFPNAGSLPGDHFSIIRPDTLEHRSYTTLKHQIRLATTVSINPPPTPSPGNSTTICLSIGKDGHFTGGDREATTDAVVALLEKPIDQRHVSIRTPWLEPTYKYTDPDAYVALLKGIRTYERAIDILMGDSIRFTSRWTLDGLIKGVLELRNFALPGVIGYAYEIWYVWPATDPKAVTYVRIPEKVATSTREGITVLGLPQDEPILLKEAPFLPSIIWEQVAPAAAFLAAEGKLHTPVNMDDWVISDRNLSELQRKERYPIGLSMD